MLALKEKILHDGQNQAYNLIEQYKAGKIRLKPGCDALQSLVPFSFFFFSFIHSLTYPSNCNTLHT